MNAKDWQQQASHFDRKGPFVPGDQFLRETGFRCPYILKEVLLAEALRRIGIKAGSSLLDVGCGRGILLDRIGAEARIAGFGVDISSESLRTARAESRRGFPGVRADARSLPFAGESFDVVLSMDVLEHVAAPGRAIEEAVRVMRPGGRLLCYAVSARNRFTFNWFLTRGLEMLGVDHWGRALHHPDLLVEPGMILSSLSDVGCDVEAFQPFHAFFTILFDQALLAFFWLVAALGLLNPGRRAGEAASRLLLGGASRGCRLLYGPLTALDAPWTRRALSNGFLVVAKKRPSPRALPAGTVNVAFPAREPAHAFLAGWRHARDARAARATSHGADDEPTALLARRWSEASRGEGRSRV